MKPPAYENDPETRITALLLGELSPTEAEEVRSAISNDPDLAVLHDRLKQTIEFVRAVIGAKGADPAEGKALPVDQTPRLSDTKRQALLDKFKVVPMKPAESEKRPERQISWWVGMAALFMVLGLMGFMLLPGLAKSRPVFKMSAIIDSERHRGLAKADPFVSEGEPLGSRSAPAEAERYKRYMVESQSELTGLDMARARFGVDGEAEPADRRNYFRGLAESAGVGIAGGQGGFGGGGGGGGGGFGGSATPNSRPEPVSAMSLSARDRGRRPSVEIAMPSEPTEETSSLLHRRGGLHAVAASGRPVEQRASERWDMPEATVGVATGDGAEFAGRILSRDTSREAPAVRPPAEPAPTLGDTPTVGQQFRAGNFASGVERYADADVPPATAPTEAASDEPIFAGYRMGRPASPTRPPARAGQAGGQVSPDGSRSDIELDALADTAADDLSRYGSLVIARTSGGTSAGRSSFAAARPGIAGGGSRGQAIQKGLAPSPTAPAIAPGAVALNGAVTRGASVNYAFVAPPVDEQQVMAPVQVESDLAAIAANGEERNEVLRQVALWGDYDNDGHLDLFVSADNKALTEEALGRTRGLGVRATPEGELLRMQSDYASVALGADASDELPVNSGQGLFFTPPPTDAYAFDVNEPAGEIEARKRLLRPEPIPSPDSTGIVAGKSVERRYTEAAGTEAVMFTDTLAVELSGPETGGVALQHSSAVKEELRLGFAEGEDLAFEVQLGERVAVTGKEVRSKQVEADPQFLQLRTTLQPPALTAVDAPISSDKDVMLRFAADGQALYELERLHEVGAKLNEAEGLESAVVDREWYAQSVEQVGDTQKRKSSEIARVVESKPATREPRPEKLEQQARSEVEDAAPTSPVQPKTPPPVPQPEVSTSDNPFSTFSLNVTDVSFKLAQASLEQGQLPDPSSIRSEEFINAFEYHDPEPSPGRRVGVAWERTRYPFAHNRDLLRFGVQTAAQGREASRPLNVVLCVDNSGSMERADRVAILREAMRVLGGQLQAGDRISVVSFARTARLWVDGLSGSRAGELAENLGNLNPEGGTNLEDALDLAYDTARRHFVPSGINRVVLLTDGAANLGNVDPEALRQSVIEQRKNGIALDSFGVGWEGYNDDLLETLSRNGDGRYGFLNTAEEAATEFADQLAGALRVTASDVKVQVEFNPRRVKTYRQIGYAKHQLTKEQFRDNTVDAAEIGAAESGNALYVIETDANGVGPVGVVRVRFKVPETGQVEETEWMIPYEGPGMDLAEASPAIRLAGTASAFSEWLAANPYAAEVSAPRLLKLLRGVPEVYDLDPRPKQLEWMIRQAGSIAGQ